MKMTGLLALWLLVFATAVANVYSQHQARKLFVEIRDLEKARDHLDEEWGRLQLEQKTWATDERVESLARRELGMTEPGDNVQILFVE
ncbi:MAG TPA: cell division protein FtsL [Gammaproteobacteria bacterium]|nr:cell division protein FtsL [Gammaproteobacteria bacterium]